MPQIAIAALDDLRRQQSVKFKFRRDGISRDGFAALFKAGEAAFGDGRFEAAIEHFERAYELSHRPVLLLNIASAQSDLNDNAAARRTLEQLIAQYPQSEAATKARQRLGQR